jgi:hypothetical protein
MDLSSLHSDVVFGRSEGRIIWQPRILCWYNDRLFAGSPLPEPYTGMTLPEIYRSLGCSDRLYDWYNPCFRRVEHPAVRVIHEELNETDTRVTIETPAGKQVAVNRRSQNTTAHVPLKWEVETEEELKVAAWREENATWMWDQDHYERSLQAVGDLGAPTIFMPRTNVQSLYIEKMGVERGVYAIYDWPDTTEAYFRAIEENHDRLIEVINESPVEIINFGENIHSGSLSPALFVTYHLPVCRRRCEKLHSAGKFVCSHWDGDCGPLLAFAQETGLDGIEAITPKPQGDVTLEEARAALGDDMFLIDGIPAVYFDETYPVQTLVDCVHQLLDLFAPKLVLGISDELSSTGDIERVRLVGRIVDEYNAAVA